MDYERFCTILNRHIFEGEKKELLQRIAKNPERFIGLFRPTKPGTKILQHLLQSHEIRMGDAFEEIIGELLQEIGFKNLPKDITDEKGNQLSLDQYFTDGKVYYFIEQKMRDDHDSSKKEGQMINFEKKLRILYKKHGSSLVGFIYFIDPSLSKNRKYYLEELEKLKKSYKGVELGLFYGKELFEYFKRQDIWKDIMLWLQRWKDSLPELPEINFDIEPEKSFEEIKELGVKTWKSILENDRLWEEGVIRAIFREGTTLKLLLEFFKTKRSTTYMELSNLLAKRIEENYGRTIDFNMPDKAF